MKIKTKLTLWVGLLFAMIALLTVLSAININKLSGDANNILADNYNTIDYCRQMLIALNKDIATPEGHEIFAENLQKQRATITEVGERQLTDKIAADFNRLVQSPEDSALWQIVHKDITDIMLLNMQAIQRKSQITGKTAHDAIWWISGAGTLCFLIAFTLLINLPSSIANPIRELTASIKQIAAKNYSERVHFESHNEFGELATSFNTMAEKLEEYAGSNLARLLMEKKRIETLINKMRDPVIGLDEKGMILFTNDKALKIIGVNKTDLIGKSIVEVAKHNDLIRLLIRDIDQTQQSDNNEKEQPIKIYADDKESYFEKEVIDINIIPTGEKVSQRIGHVIILKNVTPFKEMDFAKTNFIATISHELKTPISSIKMSIQLLENAKTGKLNDDQIQLLESIKEDSHRLLKITGELLDMSQVETGNIQLNVQPCDPTVILQYAIDTTKTQADQKNIHFTVEAAESIPKINMDSEKTAWVLTNFLTNAIRYSPENSDIIISLKRKDQCIRYEVKDFGKGIEPKYQGKVFDRYFQVPGSPKSGTGLGLAISKDFIEAQGGRIGVEGEFGSGSTFFFSFPIKPTRANNSV